MGMKEEKGFHFIECAATAGQAESLIILLHGYANHPDMFMPVAKRIQKEFPKADVLVVRAPMPLGMTREELKRHNIGHLEDVYAWHMLKADKQDHAKLALGHAFNRIPVVDQLNAFVDHQLQKRHLADENLAFFGFSMGGAMAVHAATSRKTPCAAVVCHSGLVLPFTRAAAKPDTLMIMGDKDELFYSAPLAQSKPVSKNLGKIVRVARKAVRHVGVHHRDSVARLKRAGVPVTDQVVPGLTHYLNPASINASLDFIGQRLKGGK